MSGPEAAKLNEPGIQLLKRFRLQPVETALCVHRGFHEAGLSQHSQMLGDRGLGHAKLTLDFSDRLLGRDQQAQYRAAVRLGNDFEYGFHVSVYTAYGIYVSRYMCRTA